MSDKRLSFYTPFVNSDHSDLEPGLRWRHAVKQYQHTATKKDLAIQIIFNAKKNNYNYEEACHLTNAENLLLENDADHSACNWHKKYNYYGDHESQQSLSYIGAGGMYHGGSLSSSHENEDCAIIHQCLPILICT